MSRIIENVEIRRKNEERVYRHYEEKKELKIIDNENLDTCN